MRELRTALAGAVVLTVLLGLGYPLAMTGVAHALFGAAAGGSIVSRDGRPVASTLIGQEFARDGSRTRADGTPVLEPDRRYFQGRPSATGYSADATAFANQGPNREKLARELRGYVRDYLRLERPFTPGLTARDVPPDAVTTSASGIDPQISAENAAIQANRVARERGLSRARVLALARRYSSRPLFGLAGPRSVNVVELNLALDREAPPR